MTDQFPPQPGQPQWGQPGGNPKADAKAAKAYAKAQRPFYKKKRVLIPAALLAIIGISQAGGGGGSDSVTTASDSTVSESDAPAAKAAATKAPAKPAAPAIKTSAKEMIAVLEANALKAKQTYDGKTVTVTGFVGSIDASGDYFSLLPEADAMIFTGVQVYTSDKFADQVANFEKGQAITVTGKIDDVGEVIGYALKAQTIQ